MPYEKWTDYKEDLEQINKNGEIKVGFYNETKIDYLKIIGSIIPLFFLLYILYIMKNQMNL